VKRKRAVKTKGLTSTVIQPSARGAFSGGFSSYVPSSNVPFSSVAQAPISLALETRVKQLELKADNPALNLAGNTSVKSGYKLENKSMASNEAFPYDEREPYIDDMRKAELKRKEQILKEQSQITRTEGVFNQMKKLINESPKEGGFFYMRKQTEAKKLPALEPLGQINVNMQDRNADPITDKRFQRAIRRANRKEPSFTGLSNMFQQQQIDKGNAGARAEQKIQELKEEKFAPIRFLEEPETEVEELKIEGMSALDTSSSEDKIKAKAPKRTTQAQALKKIKARLDK